MVSRPLLEWTLRQRLLADPGVELREDASALDLRFSRDAKRVDGVVVRGRDGGDSAILDADLVVDATGRASRTPEWLARRGFPVPLEEVRRVDKRYATRRFVSGPDTPAAVLVGPGPDLPRSGIMLEIEAGQHVVSLMGMRGARPPIEAAGWPAYTRSLAHPALADMLATMTPVDDEAVSYRFPANLRRRYERLDRFPEGLFVTGDALCAFDPAYGHGMTVAALDALELARVLADGGAALSQRFHRRAARHVDTPWTIATGQLPDERGRIAPGNRMFGAYLRMLLRAGADDPELAHAFARVSHLVEPPTTLMTFGRVSRVLSDSAARRSGVMGGTPVVVRSAG
jgi:2-polyprenyl-6-methoxyphenol hydroxylase-like FAD-dependent oxidoreductase